MVELNHEPETCIASGYGDTESNALNLMKISESAKELDAELVGGWAFPVGHRQWYVIKADDAHIVAELVRVTNLHLWNTITVNPVLDHDMFSEKILAKLVPQEKTA
jgi:hypothetical protein